MSLPCASIGRIVLVEFRGDTWPAVVLSTPNAMAEDSCLVEVFGLEGHDRRQIVHHQESGGDLTWRWPDFVAPTPDNVRAIR